MYQALQIQATAVDGVPVMHLNHSEEVEEGFEVVKEEEGEASEVTVEEVVEDEVEEVTSYREVRLTVVGEASEGVEEVEEEETMEAIRSMEDIVEAGLVKRRHTTILLLSEARMPIPGVHLFLLPPLKEALQMNGAPRLLLPHQLQPQVQPVRQPQILGLQKLMKA